MPIETIKQNAEILNEAIINFNSTLIEMESLKRGRETAKNRSTKKVIDDQISKLELKLSDLSNYIIKTQMNIQKLLNEELSNAI